MRAIVLGVLLAATGLTMSATLVAHHSAAAFDTTKEVMMNGTVTEWRWGNPHCILKYSAKDAAGVVKTWAVETANPTSMTQRGWSRSSFKVGDEITVTLLPARNGEPVGLMLRVVFPDGRKLLTSPPGTPVPED